MRAMFATASVKVGLFPITEKDVRFFADHNKHQHLPSDGESKLLYGPEYYNERIQAGVDFCENDLHIPYHMIDIHDCHMCVKPKDKILWVVVSKDFAKQMFMAAAREQNSKIGVIQFIPPPAIDRKVALGKSLTTFRQMDTSLRTQIRVGECDLEVWAKHHVKGEYHPYVKVDMEVIDPLEELPLINNEGRIINPRDSEKNS